MRRIKLFEAFINVDKIQKVNFILLCWAIKNLIKHNELEAVQPRYHSTDYHYRPFVNTSCFVLRSFTDWFLYNPVVNRLRINCYDVIANYLVAKKIVNFQSMRSQSFPDRDSINKSAHYVIKKMYEDEKNKTI